MATVVLVTGASSGLGKALAEHLHAAGYRVYGTSRHPKGDTSFPMLALDVSSRDSVEAAFAELRRLEGRLDVLINNAGIGLAGPTEHLTMDNIQRVFDTNVYGVVRVCQSALPLLRAGRAARIINIGSIGGEFGLPFRGMYSATKAALSVMSEALRFELKPFGIQVTTVLAGDMQTGINDHRIKDYRPEDVNYAATFEKVYAGIDQHVGKGLSAERAAARVAALIEVARLKPRYAVGPPMQEFSLLLKKLLPASWMERILSGYAKG